MATDVLRQNGGGREVFAANVALMSFSSGVVAHVLGQVKLVDEAFAA
jgi:hypothetical protein